jgi:hypothetical protein
VYDKFPSVREKLNDQLAVRFDAAQLLNRRPYTLSGPTVIRVRADGSRSFAVEITGRPCVTLTDNADTQLLDNQGNVLRDSRRERIDGRRKLVEQAALHAEDPLLRKLLASFNAAMNDPDNALVHLYEIRDALKDRRKSLRISAGKGSNWWTLGRLANEEPIRQGRHRGEHVGTALRDATEGELEEARNAASSLVEIYLGSL